MCRYTGRTDRTRRRASPTSLRRDLSTGLCVPPWLGVPSRRDVEPPRPQSSATMLKGRHTAEYACGSCLCPSLGRRAQISRSGLADRWGSLTRRLAPASTGCSNPVASGRPRLTGRDQARSRKVIVLRAVATRGAARWRDAGRHVREVHRPGPASPCVGSRRSAAARSQLHRHRAHPARADPRR
jgi:hypothetical protein